MSIQRSIVQRLFESRGLTEAEFTSGGSTYKCVFGKYYKDGEPIDRDEYFKAKEGMSPSTSPRATGDDEFTPEQIDSEMDDLEDEIEDIERELRNTHYDDRRDLEDKIDSMRRRLSDMEGYMSDEQYERSQDIFDRIPDPDNVDYESPEPDWDSMPGGHDDY